MEVSNYFVEGYLSNANRYKFYIDSKIGKLHKPGTPGEEFILFENKIAEYKIAMQMIDDQIRKNRHRKLASMGTKLEADINKIDRNEITELKLYEENKDYIDPETVPF